jgi:indolepyruvate ferredoxin oxidoreductase alpha subunit
MTGGQDSAALAKLKDICLGLGVAPEHLKIIEPLRKNHEENVAVIQKELDYKGVSVVIAQRACVRLPGERKKVIKEILAAQN